ncbi:MAG: YwmB family TATA-box binding protein [bacterium]|nr:YwmB family TATA-box binding protein [bacterium]
MNIKERLHIDLKQVRNNLVNRQAMKKVKIGLYIVALVWVGVGVQMIVNYAYRDEGKMLHAFAEAEANVVQSKLTIVGNYGDKFMTTSDKKNMIDYITGKLNIEESLDKKEVNGETTTSVIAQKQGRNANAEVELISIDSKEQNSAKKTNQYVYVTIELYNDISKVIEYKNAVNAAYEEMGISDVDASITLQGTYDRAVELEERNKITDQLLEQLQAKIVKENRTDQSNSAYTVYAYTPLINDYIMVNDSRVNLNIVYTYDKDEDITTLYVATPILNTDY